MKEKIKQHFSSQAARLKSEGNVFEYILWWVSRVMMIYACFATFHKLHPSLVLAVVLNTLATFAVSFFAAIFPQKLFLGRLSFRTQTYIDFFVIIGCFFCHCVSAYRVLEFYDKWQHFFAGLVCVFLGMELLKTMFPKEKINPKVSLLGGIGFSFSAIVIWEIFEFLADFFIKDSTNQGYNSSPDFDMLFFKIFGRGAENVGQYPLFDTLFDMMAAVVGICVAVVVFLLAFKIKSRRIKEKNEQAPKPVAVFAGERKKF